MPCIGSSLTRSGILGGRDCSGREYILRIGFRRIFVRCKICISLSICCNSVSKGYILGLYIFARAREVPHRNLNICIFETADGAVGESRPLGGFFVKITRS